MAPATIITHTCHVEAAGGSAAAASGLDQERDNRFADWRESVADGELVLSPARSGGAFDPLGRRISDVWRVDDLKAVCAVLPGRWVLATLTVDRTLFIGPEAAYQRCNERVRRVMKELCPRGVYFVAFELQSKTGDGWPHWHAMAWVPDERSASELKSAAERRWTVRTEVVDRESGEVTASVERIGWVDVSIVRDRFRAGAYIAGYLGKKWSQVATWMGESHRRFRKLRISSGCYDVMERLHRHERARGGRQQLSDSVRRLCKTRPLFERMARSGATLNIFEKRPDGLVYAGSVPVPVTDLPSMVEKYGAKVVRLGTWDKCRVVISRHGLRCLRRDSGRWDAKRAAYVAAELHRHSHAWEEMQMRRTESKSRESSMEVAIDSSSV